MEAFRRGGQGCITEVMMFRQRQDGQETCSCGKIRRKRRPGRGNSSCKGPGAGVSLACSGDREEPWGWNTRRGKLGTEQKELID